MVKRLPERRWFRVRLLERISRMFAVMGRGFSVAVRWRAVKSRSRMVCLFSVQFKRCKLITFVTGNRYINQLSRALTIPESAMKAAGQVFKLAVGLNFIQGRRTKTVAAVCLYIACRRQDGNTTMLIDFADVLMVSYDLSPFAIEAWCSDCCRLTSSNSDEPTKPC